MRRQWIEQALDIVNRTLTDLEDISEDEFRKKHNIIEEFDDIFPIRAGVARGALHSVKDCLLWGLKDDDDSE